MTEEEILRQLALEKGADAVGFADLKALDSSVRRGMPRGISLAVALDREVVAGIADGPTRDYVHEYRRVNRLLGNLSGSVADLLVDWGYEAVALPATGMDFDRETLSTSLPHKTVATRAGQGWIGKNALLTTARYGSAVRLGSVLTDAELRTAEPVHQSRCGSCLICVRVCPADAPSGRQYSPGMDREAFFDAAACNRFAEEISADIASSHTVCGMCIAACPWTEKYLEGGD